MVSIASTFKALCLSFLFIAVASRPTIRAKVFNVRRYGSKPDGKTDNANAFTSVWKRACTRISGSSKIYVPKGTFYLSGVEDIKQDTWINFQYINNLSISGSGTLDGQGKYSWPLNDCYKNTNCPKLAMVLFLLTLFFL
ncbi:putative galacturan 1,4-alpha-galacturonidase [Arabidopsis thaliana]